jgi:hypothetical protein
MKTYYHVTLRKKSMTQVSSTCRIDVFEFSCRHLRNVLCAHEEVLLHQIKKEINDIVSHKLAAHVKLVLEFSSRHLRSVLRAHEGILLCHIRKKSMPLSAIS